MNRVQVVLSGLYILPDLRCFHSHFILNIIIILVCKNDPDAINTFSGVYGKVALYGMDGEHRLLK